MLFCRLLLRFSTSVGAVLCSLLAVPCFQVGALLAYSVNDASSLQSLQSRLPLVVSPSSQVCLSFTCSCGGVAWSQVCVPSCCSCVLGSCGVSVAPFCRLGLLRALPCRAFTGRFLWFRGPSSWSFLGLFTGVLSSRFWWLRVARGSSWLLLGYPPSVACRRAVFPWCLVRRLAPLGLRCLWFPWSCGVTGLRDGATCLWSGLWSSPVHDRSEAFPSFWWVWFLPFGRGSLPQAGAVFFGMR